MSEIGDVFKAVREQKRLERALDYGTNLRALQAACLHHGVRLEQLSEHHVRVGTLDFWPSSGKYWDRKANQRGKGIQKFLKLLERNVVVGRSATTQA